MIQTSSNELIQFSKTAQASDLAQSTGLVRINEVVETYNLSSRTLRYYEEKGLIWSHHPDNKAQRYYDATALERLRQIVVLRKLQIPLKDMAAIFESESTSALIQAFVNKLESLEVEITALSELRRLVDDFLSKMLKSGIKKISAIPLLYEETEKRLAAVNPGGPVSFERISDKSAVDPGEAVSFQRLSEVSRESLRLHDVRVIRLPAVRMLTSRLKSGKIEELTGEKMQNLFALYGFIPAAGLRNCFFRKEGNYDWLMFIQIPEDYENQTPYVEEIFPGGLYAITSAYFEDMDDRIIMLKDWITNSEDYLLDADEAGTLQRVEMIEEILPWDIAAKLGKYQQDIFVPIRTKDSEHRTNE